MGYSLSSVSSVQSLSRVQCLVTPWTAACQASLSITSSQSCSNSTSVKLVMDMRLSNPWELLMDREA